MKLSWRTLRGVVALALLAGCAAGPEDVGSNDLAVTVCGQTTVKGIDVYHGDNGGNPIPWTKVKAAGMSFAFTKATEGTTFVDSSFATNWAGIKAAGMVRGAYHFFHADLDPVAQANFFLATVGPIEPGDLLVLDMETTNGQTQSTILAHATTFLQTVASATGTTPLLYTSPLFLSSYGGLGAYPLWIANYGVNCPDVPSAWKTYTFWQSQSSGSLSFISGSLDMDSFNGTEAELLALGQGATDAGADAAADAATDATAPQPDAGAADAASGMDADVDAGEPPPGAGGCACDVGPRPRDDGFALAALFGLAVLVDRRTRCKKAPHAGRTGIGRAQA